MTSEKQALAEWRDQVLDLLRLHGYEKRERPFQLSSGALSHDYIDGKRAIAKGSDLRVVAEAILALARERNATFDAVGGLTMGADALAHAISIINDCEWFSVRKEPKEHGTQRQLEGGRLKQGARVLLVDDVVTTGGSILKALRAIESTGARVVLAVSVCDRGESARVLLESAKVEYRALVTYKDLEIDPIGE